MGLILAVKEMGRRNGVNGGSEWEEAGKEIHYSGLVPVTARVEYE
jgi:hypothetical protein